MTDVATDLSDQGIRLRDYDVGEHKVTCPRCSAQRKKKHEACLNVRLDADDRAVWQCWHCAWTGSTGANGAGNGYEGAARAFKRPEPPLTMDTGHRLFDCAGITRQVPAGPRKTATCSAAIWQATPTRSMRS